MAINDKEVELLRAKVELLTAQVEALLKPREPETLIPEEFRRWAELPAEAKTQLVADEKYGPDKGPQVFEIQLVYLVKKDQSGKKERPYSEYPKVRLHAHSVHEAEAYYRELCGITSNNPDYTEYQTKKAGASNPATKAKNAAGNKQ